MCSLINDTGSGVGTSFLMDVLDAEFSAAINGSQPVTDIRL
jgi:hypothetical protein